MLLECDVVDFFVDHQTGLNDAEGNTMFTYSVPEFSQMLERMVMLHR